MPSDLLNIVQLFQPTLIAKYIILAILILYIIFAFVIFNQVRTMNRIIATPPTSEILLIVSLIHLLFAISLFVFSLVIL